MAEPVFAPCVVIPVYNHERAIGAVVGAIREQGVPMVLVNRRVDELDLPAVTADDDAGVAMAVSHLAGQGHTRIAHLAPNLLSLPGCGVLTAAKLIAETAGVARFGSEACFAMHAGVAPIPASSGRTDRHRLCRGGNRQLNAAIHRIAITQLRLPGPGQSYYRRRRAQGDSTGGAVRALKRRIARAVYQQLKLAEQRPRANSPAA